MKRNSTMDTDNSDGRGKGGGAVKRGMKGGGWNVMSTIVSTIKIKKRNSTRKWGYTNKCWPHISFLFGFLSLWKLSQISERSCCPLPLLKDFISFFLCWWAAAKATWCAGYPSAHGAPALSSEVGWRLGWQCHSLLPINVLVSSGAPKMSPGNLNGLVKLETPGHSGGDSSLTKLF